MSSAPSGLGALNALAPDFEGPVGVEIRGYTSREFPKKQYGFETRDATGDDVDEALLGMPAESDWVLHAPFMDKSRPRPRSRTRRRVISKSGACSAAT